ncbi:myomegalin [Micropterus salmoides]|uniref:myomegalin n=1 Tax=Micropterus salmoides TaxID=27706 RepID=UPI0018EA3690|nr:myomegalin [Micropterus salmoides]
MPELTTQTHRRAESDRVFRASVQTSSGFPLFPPAARLLCLPASLLPRIPAFSFQQRYQQLPGCQLSNESWGQSSGEQCIVGYGLWHPTTETWSRPVLRILGVQSGASNTGSDLMKEHLREIRTLRQRLEDSIQTNDRLRQQLEERLARTSSEKGAPTNIYIQGLDSVGQLSSEIRLLKEENVSLQNQLKQATREGNKEAEQLREAALLEQARLKEAELEAERWAEQSRKLQTEAEALNQEIAQLKQDRQRNQETINRFQHEVSILQQQLCESHSLVQSLQRELQVYHRVCGVTANTHSAGQSSEGTQHTATFDPRELHIQLEQQLSGQTGPLPRSRRQLFNDDVPSPPVRDTGLVSPSSPLHPAQKHAEDTGAADRASTLQGQAPDGSFSNRHGRHAVGHIDDFKALQRQILEGSALLRKMDATLHSLSNPPEFSLHQPSDSGSVRKLLSDSKTLRQILEEAGSLLRMFWRAALPNFEESKQDPSLREEVVSLRLRLSEQEQALKDAMERVKSSNRTKDSMEHFIVSQLSRTQDVLRKAKTNLQVKTQEASVSSPSLSGWGVMRPWTSSISSSSAVLGPAHHQRPLQPAFR